MPGLPRFARRFDKQHRLHTLHIRPDHPGQHLDDGRVRQVLVHRRRKLVREVDAKIPAQYLFVGFIRLCRDDPPNVPALAPADRRGLGTKFLDLCRRQSIFYHQIPIFMVKSHVFRGDRRSLWHCQQGHFHSPWVHTKRRSPQIVVAALTPKPVKFFEVGYPQYTTKPLQTPCTPKFNPLLCPKEPNDTPNACRTDQQVAAPYVASYTVLCWCQLGLRAQHDGCCLFGLRVALPFPSREPAQPGQAAAVVEYPKKLCLQTRRPQTRQGKKCLNKAYKWCLCLPAGAGSWLQERLCWRQPASSVSASRASAAAV